MHEILRSLDGASAVLDLGCARGSFPAADTCAMVVRVDREGPKDVTPGDRFVQADAACLPFRDHAFAAVISNHSLEHFDDFAGALREAGRVIRPGGALFVAVPDASTLTDRLYRWLSKGGGHVNAFTSADDTAATIERITGLRHVATRPLFSSLSFANRHNSPRPRPRRLTLVGAGYEWSLCAYVWVSRRLDRWLNRRTSVYGWAFYFGEIGVEVDERVRANVCVRCGSGHATAVLAPGVTRSRFGFRVYRCPNCGARNPFVDD